MTSTIPFQSFGSKTVLSIAVAIALSACGSSGGGGSSNSTGPNIGGTTTTTPQNEAIPVNFNPNSTGNVSSGNITSRTDAEIAQHNQNIKANHVSEVAKTAEKQLQDTKTGKGGVVVVVDRGIDRNGAPNLNRSNVDSTMDTKAGVVSAKETSGTHGTRMSTVIVNDALDVRQRHYAGVEEDTVNDFLIGGMNTFKKLANDPTVDVNAIVVSNSWSNRNQAMPISYKKEADQMVNTYVKGVNGKTGVAIFATGNETNNNPAGTARLVELNSELKKVSIAVTGMNAKGQVPFNKCGVAADYCVTANGEQTLMTGNNYEVTSYGTSPATASVAAAAARVAGAFPFMSAENVADTIKTTVTPYGNRAIYGLGILNADKALRGFGRLDKMVDLNVSGAKDQYVMSNDIGGTGGLTVSGDSTLVLTGNNTFNGGINVVNGGTVMLNGKNSSSVNVSQGSKLSIGDNTKGITMGSVTNNGTVSSQSLADVTINGNFKNSATSSVNKYIGSTINVTGKADLDGTLNLTGVAKGYVTKAGSKETLISANEVNGNFKQVNVKDSTLTNTTVAVDGNKVVATVSRNAIGTAVHMEGMESVEVKQAAKTAETVMTKIDEKINNGETLTDKEARYAQVFMESDNNVAQTVFKTSVGTHARAQQSVADNAVTRSVTNVNNTIDNKGAWVSYNHSSPEYKANDIKADASENGVTIGTSFAVDKKQVIGVSVNSQNTDFSETLGNANRSVKGKVQGVDVSYAWQGPVIGYATVGVDKISLDDSGKGKQYRAGFGVTKSYALTNDMLVSPDFGLFYTESDLKNININELTEAEKLTYKNLSARLGVTGQYVINSNVVLFGSAAIQQDLINKTNSTNKIAGVKVSEELKNRKETKGSVSLGAQTKFDNFTIGASVGYEKGRNWDNKKVNVGVNYSF